MIGDLVRIHTKDGDVLSDLLIVEEDDHLIGF